MKRRPRPFGELEAIELLERILSASAPGVETGIGDDAAVLRLGRNRLVWTVDSSEEGVHFDRRWLSLSDVGFRAHEAAVSDLAAMGAEPIAALSALTLPKSISREELSALARGQAASARRTRCPVIGGNIASGSHIAVTTTVLGKARAPLLRSGARVGDELWLVGDVGLARTGLELLSRGVPLRSPAERRAAKAWRRPQARLREGLALVGRARAALDVSDGLGGDLGHLAGASGVCVVVERAALERALPAALGPAARALGREPLEQALLGGEDYALVASGPAKRRPAFARRVGRIERGEGAWLESPNGERQRLGRGFDHLG